MRIVGGDIGGTNTRLALFEITESTIKIIEKENYKCKDFNSFSLILKTFLHSKKISLPISGCFGAAGLIVDGECKATNFPWHITLTNLIQVLQTDTVYLLNDLVANAYGIESLTSENVLVLNTGNPDALGNAAVVSAGTGLGEAGLYWDGSRHHPFASEGGNANFGPVHEVHRALLHYLSKRFSHVSWERIISGSGLINIYEFLCEYRSVSPLNEIKKHIEETNSPALITKMGLSGECKICQEVLEIFVFLYGSEAGNFALKIMASGGVYIGGGIAPKIIKMIKKPQFMEGFLHKGQMKQILQEIPVKVILNDNTALLGTAEYCKLKLKNTCSD